MIKKGRRVSIGVTDSDKPVYGVVSGYAIADNYNGDTELYYAVTLNLGFWNADGDIYTTRLLAHPDNVREIQAEADD